MYHTFRQRVKPLVGNLFYGAKDDGRLAALRGKITEMLSGLTHIGDELPRQWVTIRQELEGIKDAWHVTGTLFPTPGFPHN